MAGLVCVLGGNHRGLIEVIEISISVIIIRGGGGSGSVRGGEEGCLRKAATHALSTVVLPTPPPHPSLSSRKLPFVCVWFLIG